MTVMAVNDLVWAITTWDRDGVLGCVSRWWRVTVAINGPDHNLALQRIDQFMGESINNLIGLGTPLRSTETQLYRTGSQLEVLSTSQVNQTVSTTTYPFPASVALLHSLRCAVAKPRQVARMYWPFIATENVASDGTLSAVGDIAMSDIATSLLGTITKVGGGKGVILRSAIVTRTGSYVGDVSSVTWHDGTATQKRRNRYLQKESWQ